jgi:hypothetical protein
MDVSTQPRRQHHNNHGLANANSDERGAVPDGASAGLQ